MTLIAVAIHVDHDPAVPAEVQDFLKSKNYVGKTGSYFGDPVIHVYDETDLICTVSSTIKMCDLAEMLRVAERSLHAGIQRGMAAKSQEIRAVLGIG